MTKGELMDLVLSEDELRNTDPAIPQKLFDELRELGVEPHGRFVMVYTDKGGTLVDLYERFYHMFNRANDLLEAAQEVLEDAMDKEDAWPSESSHNDHTMDNLISPYRELHWYISEMHKNIADYVKM